MLMVLGGVCRLVAGVRGVGLVWMPDWLVWLTDGKFPVCLKGCPGAVIARAGSARWVSVS